jgi:hypothetical protein
MITDNSKTTQFAIYYDGLYIDSMRNYTDADERLSMFIFCDIIFDSETKEWVLRANGIIITRHTDKKLVDKAREEYIMNNYNNMLKGK